MVVTMLFCVLFSYLSRLFLPENEIGYDTQVARHVGECIDEQESVRIQGCDELPG
jgi:hypothetical protein